MYKVTRISITMRSISNCIDGTTNTTMLQSTLLSAEDVGAAMTTDRTMQEQVALDHFDDDEENPSYSDGFCNAPSSPQIMPFGNNHSEMFEHNDGPRENYMKEDTTISAAHGSNMQTTQSNRTNFSKVYDKPHSSVAKLPPEATDKRTIPHTNKRPKAMDTHHFPPHTLSSPYRFCGFDDGGIRHNTRLNNDYNHISSFAQGPNNPYHEYSRHQHHRYRHDPPTSPPLLSRQFGSSDFNDDSSRRSQISSMPFPDVSGRAYSPTFNEHYTQDSSLLQCEDVTPLQSEGDIPTARSLSAYFIKTPEQPSLRYRPRSPENMDRVDSSNEPEHIQSRWPGGYHLQHHDSAPTKSPLRPLKEPAPFDMHSSTAFCSTLSPPSVTANDLSGSYSYVAQHNDPQHNSSMATTDLSFETDIDNILQDKKREDFFSRSRIQSREGMELSTLLQPSDRMLVSEFTNAVVDQLEIASFCPRDRKGTRNNLAIGFPGFTCKHCKGTKSRTGGRYFPSSIKTMSDSKKTLFAISRHLSICKKCPQEIKDKIDSLLNDHIESRKRNNRQGTQRAFFRNIWAFLHPYDRKGE